MAVKIRLARAGAKKHPYYHVVATDSASPRDGKFLEALGAYDPVVTPVKLELDHERLDYWVKRGAILSETVSQLIKRHKKAQPAASQA